MSQDKGKYEVTNGGQKTADDMVELYKDLIARYPALIMIIDPFRKEDREQWPKLCELISEKLVGDDDFCAMVQNYFVTIFRKAILLP